MALERLPANKCKVPCQQFQTCQDIAKGVCCVPVPREEIAYVTCTYRNTCIEKPDFLATIDLDPCSSCYGQVIHRLFMPNLGDELHSFGLSDPCVCPDNCGTRWNKLIVPGLISSRIYVVDLACQCRAPRVCKLSRDGKRLYVTTSFYSAWDRQFYPDMVR
nr:selenium-binding protein 1-like [Columba livia]